MTLQFPFHDVLRESGVMGKSGLFSLQALDLNHESCDARHTGTLNLLAFRIIPSIRMHIKYVGDICNWNLGNASDYYGACSDFPLTVSLWTHFYIQ